MSTTKASSAGSLDMEAFRKSIGETIENMNRERALEDMKRPTERTVTGSAKDLPGINQILDAFRPKPTPAELQARQEAKDYANHPGYGTF